MDIFPAQPRPSKRVRLEKEERKFSGGMRNPALALRRLAGLKEAGKDVSWMWNNLVTDKPEALEVAALYWTRASSRNGATGWSNYGGLKVMPKWTCGASICFAPPLQPQFWEAWRKFQRGPGTLLGKMGERRSPVWHVIGDNGIGLQNYGSLADNPENALVHININQMVGKGFAAVMRKEEACQSFSQGSRLQDVLVRTKIDPTNDATEHRIIIDPRWPKGNRGAT